MYGNQAAMTLLSEWGLRVGAPVPPHLIEAVQQALADKSTITRDVTHDSRIYSFSIAPIEESDYANAYGHDVTDRVRSEERIRQALTEREALIRELYHRTKNNMNIVCSMVSLKAAYSTDDTVTQLSREIETKIQSMSLVHQKLYESQNLSRIALDDYLRDLFHLLQDSYRDQSNPITLNLDLEHVLVTIDYAIPMGLVISELFANTVKYAFPDRGGGGVHLHLALDESSDHIELEYADDGVGPPPEFDPRAHKTLGIQTMIMLVEHQLRGSIRFRGTGGFRCLIRFSRTLHPTLQDLTQVVDR